MNQNPSFSLLSDMEIVSYVNTNGIIDPFIEKTIRSPGFISYGLSSNVYDVRLQPRIQLFTKKLTAAVLDPVKGYCEEYSELFGEEFTMPPHSFALGVTIEKFNMPNDLFGLVLGKSTYARYGIVVNPTCIMPGMKGEIVIELSNTCPMPVKIYAGPLHGICSIVFFRSNPCTNVYNGNYQNQSGIVLPCSKL